MAARDPKLTMIKMKLKKNFKIYDGDFSAVYLTALTVVGGFLWSVFSES